MKLINSLLGKKTEKRVVGDDAERIAEQYLHEHGLKTIARNYQCRYGEIDLIMQDGEVLVFAEVRYRASKDFGGAAASIHVAKQRRIIAAAGHYLTAIRQPPPCRFDAILLNKLNIANVEWMKDAFGM
jgi:putative endonuclease